MDVTDTAGPVRAGEELDAARLRTFLEENLDGLRGELLIRQFPGGRSNLTYLVQCGDRELILRRPPFGRKAKGAHDMGREYRLLQALRPVFPYCPKVFAYTEDEAIIGSPFYVMERVKGLIIRREFPPGVSYTRDEARKLCDNLADVHIALHNVDYQAAGLGDFGNPDGYVRRQVEGWIDRWHQAKTPDAPEAEEVVAWLAAKMPPDSGRAAVIHNDFKLDNVVLDEKDPLRVIAVLDWEMATIGDPLMDIGNILAYRIQEDDPPEMQLLGFMPRELEFCQTRREMVDYYIKRSNLSFGDINYYYCFGLFRLAVISQQIYYRYYHGQTKDERFAPVITVVGILLSAAARTIEHPVI